MTRDYELEFLKSIIGWKLELEVNGKESVFPDFKLKDPFNSQFHNFIKEHGLNQAEIVTLLIALTPHISPEFFKNIIYKYLPNGGDFPEFGGVKGKNRRGILPTDETVLCVLPGNNIEKLRGISNVVLK